jgi:hypothetical protein
MITQFTVKINGLVALIAFDKADCKVTLPGGVDKADTEIGVTAAVHKFPFSAFGRGAGDRFDPKFCACALGSDVYEKIGFGASADNFDFAEKGNAFAFAVFNGSGGNKQRGCEKNGCREKYNAFHNAGIFNDKIRAFKEGLNYV